MDQFARPAGNRSLMGETGNVGLPDIMQHQERNDEGQGITRFIILPACILVRKIWMLYMRLISSVPSILIMSGKEK